MDSHTFAYLFIALLTGVQMGITGYLMSRGERCVPRWQLLAADGTILALCFVALMKGL